MAAPHRLHMTRCALWLGAQRLGLAKQLAILTGLACRWSDPSPFPEWELVIDEEPDARDSAPPPAADASDACAPGADAAAGADNEQARLLARGLGAACASGLIH
jgi:hypothetical protein